VVLEKKEQWNFISAQQNHRKRLKSSHIMLEPVAAGARYDVIYEADLGIMTCSLIGPCRIIF
jgi:hypothetical protein